MVKTQQTTKWQVQDIKKTLLPGRRIFFPSLQGKRHDDKQQSRIETHIAFPNQDLQRPKKSFPRDPNHGTLWLEKSKRPQRRQFRQIDRRVRRSRFSFSCLRVLRPGHVGKANWKQRLGHRYQQMSQNYLWDRDRSLFPAQTRGGASGLEARQYFGSSRSL